MTTLKVLLLALAAAWGLFGTTAFAQYPPPAGNVTRLTTPTLIPADGEPAPIFGTALDNNGHVLGNEDGQADLDLSGGDQDSTGDSLATHPGHAPVVTPKNFKTSLTGNFAVTVDPGDFKGVIRVKITIGKPVDQGGKGTFAAQLNLGVGQVVAPAQPANVVPFGFTPAPPNTGAIALPGGGLAPWALPLVIVAALGGATVMVRARRRA